MISNPRIELVPGFGLPPSPQQKCPFCQKQEIYFKTTIHQGTGIDSTQERCSREPPSRTDAKFNRLIH